MEKLILILGSKRPKGQDDFSSDSDTLSPFLLYSPMLCKGQEGNWVFPPPTPGPTWLTAKFTPGSKRPKYHCWSVWWRSCTFSVAWSQRTMRIQVYTPPGSGTVGLESWGSWLRLDGDACLTVRMRSTVQVSRLLSRLLSLPHGNRMTLYITKVF